MSIVHLTLDVFIAFNECAQLLYFITIVIADLSLLALHLKLASNYLIK